MTRPAGVPNKPKRRLLQLLQEKYPGYHPVLEMAKIANTTDDQQLAANMHKEVAKYVEPALKAIEHTGEGGGPLFNFALDLVGKARNQASEDDHK